MFKSDMPVPGGQWLVVALSDLHLSGFLKIAINVTAS
jgi:hypothetical protein